MPGEVAVVTAAAEAVKTPVVGAVANEAGNLLRISANKDAIALLRGGGFDAMKAFHNKPAASVESTPPSVAPAGENPVAPAEAENNPSEPVTAEPQPITPDVNQPDADRLAQIKNDLQTKAYANGETLDEAKLNTEAQAQLQQEKDAAAKSEEPVVKKTEAVAETVEKTVEQQLRDELAEVKASNAELSAKVEKLVTVQEGILKVMAEKDPEKKKNMLLEIIKLAGLVIGMETLKASGVPIG